MPGPTSYFTRDHLDSLEPAERELVERRERDLGAAYRLFYEEPVEIVRGSGTKLYDSAGAEYLDVYNNVPSVGHAHPRVVDAIATQAALVNTHTRYLHRGILDYSEELLGTLPAELDNIMYTCTGSEANDLALRIAKNATGAQGVIVTRNGYHGVTTEIAAISPSLGGLESVAPWVRIVDAPLGDGAALASEVAAAAEELRASEFGFAAFIADSIFASDGVLPGQFTVGQPGFLSPVIDAVHAAGGLYIADEVQPGFGRLGTGMWGFARHGIVPDIMTVGKPMGNGMPIAAMVARKDLVDAFGEKGRYFNTFGGNPVSIAAAQAVLEVIRDEQLIENAQTVGRYLQAGLTLLQASHDAIGAIRGSGLFIGVDIVRDGQPDEAQTIALINELRRRRVLIGASGLANNVLKVRPPLPFSMDDADRFIAELDGALRAEQPA